MAIEATVRRSSRDRRQATTFYDDAKQELEERQFLSPAKKGRPSTQGLTKSEDNDDDDDMGSNASNSTDEEDNDKEDDSDASDEDEKDEDLNKKSLKKTKTAAERENRSTKAATPSQKKKPPKVVVQVGKSTLHKDATVAPKKARGATSLLYSLARKVLDDEEQESLVAKLLCSKNEAARKQICLDVIQHHRDDPNACQVKLLNLVFRVVGGSSLSALPDDTELEEMGSDDWSKVITDLVDDMRYCAAEHVLICADPNGAVVAKTTKTATSMGVREFRTVYRNFWSTLTEVALEDNAGRFEIEMLRDWLSRTHELTLVAQPDIRAAAVLASLEMSLGALQRTVILKSKEVTTGRQLKSSTGKKAEAFQYKLDTLQRSRQDLEEIVDSTFSTVFMNRYRDSNPSIRAENIAALSKMTLLRPDIYLSDKYLKYIGWTLSDKVPCVRIASLSALTAPFLQKNIELASMENVIRKFLPRLADCTIDVDIQVQEKAMALFLLLDRANFLEEFEDDALWAQINNRALATDTSAVVRRDALQFILDQLEAFDYEGEEEGRSTTWAKDKNASLVQSLNKTAAKQLSTLAGWIGHALTDGNIPMDHIRIHLTDYVVESLRSLPEHRSLVTNWAAMILAIKDCEYVPSSTRDKAEERTEIARERVMVRILSRAAQIEVMTVAPEFLHIGVDPELEEIEGLTTIKAKLKGKGKSHEELSSALLKALPELLIRFKTDADILTSISSLPRLLLPSVFSLSHRKGDFIELVKILSEIFLYSSSETVLLNISDALAFFARADHVRSQEAQVQLQGLATTLSDRLITLLREPERDTGAKGSNRSRSKASKGMKNIDGATSDGSTLNQTEKEIAISMSLRRLRILAKRLDLSQLMDESGQKETMTKLRDAIAVGLSTRLEARQVILSDESLDGPISVPEIWNDGDSLEHEAVSNSVKDALQFLLVSLAWSLRKACADDPKISMDTNSVHDEDDANEEMEDHPFVQQRAQLLEFICLCFEQFLPDVNQDLYTDQQFQFSDVVQTAAFQTSGDLRALLPKVWADASSPFLRLCALTDDTSLIGGSIRYFRSREHQLREVEDQEVEDVDRVCDLLLPFCRAFVANWSKSNRREAGYAMAHIVGSGQASQHMLTAMSRIVKRMDPVHLLETHMASLRTSFDDWLNSEPEDIESDRPTDEEMAAYALAEKEHREGFDLLVQQAGRLSQSLGVGKVDPLLEKPLLGFCREGIRFAFSTDVPGGEEPLLPGGRLTFLLLLGKYVPWVRRNSSFSEVVVQNVIARDEELQSDPEFDQAHQDDLNALAAFRKIIGLKADTGTPAKSPRSIASVSQVSDGDESDVDDDLRLGKSSHTGTTKNKRPRLSRGSSIGSSVRSVSGIMSALSPLLEEGDDSGEDSPLLETRKRKHEEIRGASAADIDSGEDEPMPVRKGKLGKARRSSVGSALSGPIQEEEASEASSE